VVGIAVSVSNADYVLPIECERLYFDGCIVERFDATPNATPISQDRCVFRVSNSVTEIRPTFIRWRLCIPDRYEEQDRQNGFDHWL
jgi:hypothetical protein